MKSKMTFEEYLVSMVGEEDAQEILEMKPRYNDKEVVVIDGRQGPTGKTTLAGILREHGYQVLEMYQCKVVHLDTLLQHPIADFNDSVE